MTEIPSGHVTVPTELAALAAGVTVATIRKWASRGKLTRYGSRRRAEYDLDELYQLTANGPARGCAGCDTALDNARGNILDNQFHGALDRGR